MRSTVELRLLQSVTTLAEELSFTRAARKLYVAQSALSRQIKELEASLGVKLFDRSTRQVILTRAGAAFVEEARAALIHSERAGRLAQAVCREENSPTLVGFSPHYNFELLRIIRKRSISYFGPRGVTFISSFTREQVQRVLDGTWDAGLCFFPVNDPGLEILPLLEEPVSVILHKDHKLVQKHGGAVRHQALKSETMILFARTIHPGFSRQLDEFWVSIGFAPKATQDVNTITEALALVGSGAGVALVKSSLRNMLPPDVAMLDFPPRERMKVGMGVLCRKSGRSARAERFVRLLSGLGRRACAASPSVRIPPSS